MQIINTGSKTIKSETHSNTSEDKCFDASYPKPLIRIFAGVMNGKAIDIPKPEYPEKARLRKIVGDIKAEVFVDETGKVIWARVNNGHQLLRASVKKVVCKAMFKPR